jgi:hypothetical protein
LSYLLLSNEVAFGRIDSSRRQFVAVEQPEKAIHEERLEMPIDALYFADKKSMRTRHKRLRRFTSIEQQEKKICAKRLQMPFDANAWFTKT